MSGETDQFLSHNKSKPAASPPRNGCCHTKGTAICCMLTGALGAAVVLVGILVLLLGEGYLEKAIEQSMALSEGSDRLESWLHPPVTPHLTGYAFHITNPEAVLQGKKPILEEKGPYVYKAVNIKDADGNLQFHEDHTITYRLRKLYFYEPSLSGPGLDPAKDYLTVPNIPLWTGLNRLKDKGALARSVGEGLVLGNGLAIPFINVTFDGLLWGYEDELPCLSLDMPSECQDEEASPFGSSDDDDDDDWGWDKRKKKRRRKRQTQDGQDDRYADIENDPESEWHGIAKPKAEFVDCKCNWGLFRDRNVTMREPVRFFSGVGDLSSKGVVTKYDGRDTLGWWAKDSVCDQVKGQDSSTLPPGITKETVLDVFISLMCRGLPLQYEKETEHAGIRTYRFIPPLNAMGAHDDPDPEKRNPDNECYCLEDEGFKCYKSGVLNMEPCKRATQAPLALSMPHFYNADPVYQQGVGGLTPNKEDHQFFLDVVPEFGFPLAIRPRFQLNILIGRYASGTWDKIQSMQDEILMPFLWAQDGFDEPSEEMAEKIKMGLGAPQKIPLLGAVVCLFIGAVLMAICLGFFFWQRRVRASRKFDDANQLGMSPYST
ncbi:hypothetical protein TCAL_08665 [Tigriopus californicus]|uniref:Scavenger receptor class B member 1 n=1 Tax=Tigriopus californicus TaxID=6832 RepID=A0A553PBA6_TIGCA|nr:lysosome membrane protein 2-like [Tigriopus californicus]TRY74958.1 hypothetical protein TCAL_08665 [Tigriopus californicus]|eukprot:TCALIF_08665-PA protein Name:"Similar to Scarb1 Scavenger receptor class B member 1 (Mus musculus)" AED:0.01 eAED:0.01 QI:218/1/1/1/0.5/0.33/3/826/601